MVIRVKVKRVNGNNDLPLPTYESEGSSGLDLRAAINDSVTLAPGQIKLIPTGLKIALPPGFEAQIRPRSGLALSYGIGMVNSPGTVDSDYRGEIGVILINWGERPFTIRRGDRIAQMVISRIEKVELLEVKDLDETQRGTGGFGHTGLE